MRGLGRSQAGLWTAARPVTCAQQRDWRPRTPSSPAAVAAAHSPDARAHPPFRNFKLIRNGRSHAGVSAVSPVRQARASSDWSIRCGCPQESRRGHAICNASEHTAAGRCSSTSTRPTSASSASSTRGYAIATPAAPVSPASRFRTCCSRSRSMRRHLSPRSSRKSAICCRRLDSSSSHSARRPSPSRRPRRHSPQRPGAAPALVVHEWRRWRPQRSRAARCSARRDRLPLVVRAGDRLTPSEADTRLRSLDGIDLPLPAPRGRAVLLRLSLIEIGPQFGR